MPSKLTAFDGYDKEKSSAAYRLQNWRFLRGKTGGANDAGLHGGLYQVNFADNQEPVLAYLKKDPQEDKNICEVFSSQLMRFIASETGENPDVIANVSYVPTASDGVYIASEVFDGYRDLFVDAHLAYHLPTEEPLKDTVPNWKVLPQHRPSYLQHDPAIDVMIRTGRYQDLTVGLALRAIPDDPDLHYENIGAVPIKRSGPKNYLPLISNGSYQGFVLWTEEPHNGQPFERIEIGSKIYYKQKVHEYDTETNLLKSVSGMSDYEIISDNVIEYCVEVEGKSYIIPARNNTRAAHIDFGGSLGDFRLFNRHLDGKIHVNKLLDLIRYRPSSSGPPAYHKKLPAALMEGNEFFHVLARFSMISQDKLAAKIEEEIDTAIETYRNKPEVLIRFAKRVGAPIPHDAKNNLNALGASLKEFITNNMLSKQQHAKTLFLNHFCRLPRSEQNNLLNNLHADISSPTPKQQYLQKFYQQLRAENNELFNTLKEIDALLLPNISQSYHDLKNSQGENPLLPVGASLNRFKSVLHSRLCNAYFKGNLESETKRIGEILVESRELMQAFSEHYQKVVDPKLPAEERLAAIDSFMDAVKTFEKEAIKPSAMQQFAIAASIFAGSLLGAIIGAAVGLIVGVTVGSILGHAGGAVVGAGAGSVIGAVKGAGFGTVIAMGVAAFLFGSAGAVGGGVSGRGLFFSKTQQAAVDFSRTTRDMLSNEKKAILEATEAQESDESHSHGADPSNP